jgi:hypothetical protein
MNTLLPSRYDERIQRLALGIEPQDAARGGRTGLPVRVLMDRAPALVPRDPTANPWEPSDGREAIARNDSCRHRLLLDARTRSPLDLRIVDAAQRFVPRRVSVELPVGSPPASPPAPPPGSPPGSPPEARLAGRIIRPALFPGAAYPVPAGAVGCRGRVTWGDGQPLRWARVVAERGDGTVVGRAHGDDRGEFLLLLGSATAVGADLTLPLGAVVTVLGPPGPLSGDPADDPLADLPLEAADDSDEGTAVLAGERDPDGYVALASRTVEFGLDGLRSEEFDLP